MSHDRLMATAVAVLSDGWREVVRRLHVACLGGQTASRLKNWPLPCCSFSSREQPRLQQQPGPDVLEGCNQTNKVGLDCIEREDVGCNEWRFILTLL